MIRTDFGVPPSTAVVVVDAGVPVDVVDELPGGAVDGVGIVDVLGTVVVVVVVDTAVVVVVVVDTAVVVVDGGSRLMTGSLPIDWAVTGRNAPAHTESETTTASTTPNERRRFDPPTQPVAKVRRIANTRAEALPDCQPRTLCLPFDDRSRRIVVGDAGGKNRRQENKADGDTDCHMERMGEACDLVERNLGAALGKRRRNGRE